MNKQEIIKFLETMEDTTPIKATFTHTSRVYANTSNCIIHGVSMVYSADGWSAILNMVEEADKDSEDVVTTPTNITKALLLKAIALLDDESNLSAIFTYYRFGLQYKAEVTGLEIIYTTEGVNVVLKTYEIQKEETEAAA